MGGDRLGRAATRSGAKGDGAAVALRQGDVLLVPVAELPAGCESVKRRAGRLVLAEGEATGHAHVVVGRSRLVERRESRRWSPPVVTRYVLVEQAAVLEHEEHLPVELAVGVYEVRRQREYRPERSVWVAD
jgi:hypothetical protein